jgi:hypothetical protein
MVKKELL